MKHILANKNNNIQICDNGKQALETYHQMQDVDLLILDIHMPVLNGIDVCKAIRENDNEVPILALTADVNFQNKHLYIDHGFTDIVTKPLKLPELYQFIKSQCQTQ